jgi:hypothetical protein
VGRLTWLLRELRAQLSRFGLALGVLSAGVVVLGLCLPIVDRAGISGESPVALDNSLIGYREGFVLLALTSAALLLLGAYRRYGLARPVVALLVVALGIAIAQRSESVADGSLLDPCSARSAVPAGDHVCPVDQPFHVQNRNAGYGFLIVELGAGGLVAAGVFLLLPASVPRRRRKTVPGREAIVWL